MANPSAIKAGEAFVELGTLDKALVAGLASAEKLVEASGARMAAIGATFLKLGAAIEAPLLAGVKVASDFSDQMAMVGTMLDDSDFERFMPGFTSSVRDLSGQFGESTETIARGLFDILSAAVDASKATDVLIVSMTAAQAGFTTTAVAADAITTILNSYQLGADQAMLVSDLLFATVKRGKTTFEELAQAIGQVAATASSAGLTQEEMAAAVATMTRNGVKTDIAVTALNATLMAFLKPTSRASAAAKKLGIDLSTQGLRADGLIGVMKKLDGATAEQVAGIFENRRALKGIFPLLQDMAGFTFDIDLAQRRLGLTEQALSRRTSELAFKINRLKQVGVDTFRALGKAIETEVGVSVDEIRGLIGLLNEWIGANPEVILGVAKLALSLLAAGTALFGMGRGIQFVSGLLSPTGLFVGGLIAILAWGGALDGVMTKWRAFIGDFAIGGRTISEWLDVLARVWENLAPIWGAGTSLLLQGFKIFMQSLKIAAFKLAQQINMALTRMLLSINQTLVALLTSGDLGAIAKDHVKGLTIMTTAMLAASTKNMKMWEQMLIPEQWVMDAMKDRLGKAFTNLKSVTGTQAEALKSLFGEVLGDVFKDIGGTEGVAALADLKRRLGDALTTAAQPRQRGAGGLGGVGDDIATAGTFSARAVSGLAGMGIFTQQLNAQMQMVNILTSIDGKTPDSPVARAG